MINFRVDMNVAIVAMVNTSTTSGNGSVAFEQCPPVDSKGFDPYPLEFDAVRFLIRKSGCEACKSKNCKLSIISFSCFVKIWMCRT